jgi:hypothetical protein
LTRWLPFNELVFNMLPIRGWELGNGRLQSCYLRGLKGFFEGNAKRIAEVGRKRSCRAIWNVALRTQYF